MTSVTIRPLPPQEWDKLQGLPLTAERIPDPYSCTVLVAENSSGEIVGTWMFAPIAFLEGMWVREDYRRKSSVGARLVKAMKTLLLQWGVPTTYTVVQSKDVQDLAERVGFSPVPAQLMCLTMMVDN